MESVDAKLPKPYILRACIIGIDQYSSDIFKSPNDMIHLQKAE
jgi:hypothetical protein